MIGYVCLGLVLWYIAVPIIFMVMELLWLSFGDEWVAPELGLSAWMTSEIPDAWSSRQHLEHLGQVRTTPRGIW